MSSSVSAFERAMGRRPTRSGEFNVPIRPTLKPLDPGALYHYWHPDRHAVEPCPKDFAKLLADVHADLAICRPPAAAPTASRPWLVWYRKASVTHYLSPGWVLIFVWQLQDLTPLPLDNRLFANLYRCSARMFGGAEAYFTSIVGKMEADKAAEEKAQQAYRHDRALDYFEYTKIKSSGRGNKFARHQDGTVAPSRGERNWDADLGLRVLPGPVADDMRAKREAKREAQGRRRGKR